MVFSEAGSRSAKESAAELEQFRFSLGELLGKHNLALHPPAQIFQFRSKTEPSSEPLKTRTGAAAFKISEGGVPPWVRRQVTRLLLQENVGRLPPKLERGLETFLSTTEVSGAKVTWGLPPEPNERDADWALVEWFVTRPETYGKFRVFLGNLVAGVDEEVAFRNSVGQSREQVEPQVIAFLRAGDFHTIDGPSRALSPERDLVGREVSQADMNLHLADLLDSSSEGLYDAMLQSGTHQVEAYEGLAMLSARNNEPEKASKFLRRAIEGGSKNAAAMVAYARVEPDAAKAREVLEKAVAADPNSAEAHFLLGSQLEKPAQRIEQYTIATKLAPRELDYWVALARLLAEQKRWTEAAKAWAGAEQASATAEEREKMLQARLSIEGQRLDFENSERRNAELARKAEMDRLKQQALAELHAAEAKVNQGRTDASSNAIPWDQIDSASNHLEGTLVQVDCVGKQLRLVIRGSDGKLTKLSGGFDAKGAGDPDLACGSRKERLVTVDYNPKPNARTGTAGEIVAIAFR